MEKWFLGKGEEVELQFENLGTPLYITNKRVILASEGWLGSKNIKEISLKHLSQVNASKEVPVWLIVLGVVLAIVGFVMLSQLANSFGLIIMIVGFVCIVLGFIGSTTEIVFIADTGYSLKTPFKTQEQFEKIIRIVRELEH